MMCVLLRSLGNQLGHHEGSLQTKALVIALFFIQVSRPLSFHLVFAHYWCDGWSEKHLGYLSNRQMTNINIDYWFVGERFLFLARIEFYSDGEK